MTSRKEYHKHYDANRHQEKHLKLTDYIELEIYELESNK